MEVCLGMKADGKLLNTTLAEMHSLVIGGYSGCGKTALVNNLITQLSNAEIYIFDVKKIIELVSKYLPFTGSIISN